MKLDFFAEPYQLHLPGGLTVEGLKPGDMPAVVPAGGLGVFRLGAPYGVERVMHFPAGSGNTDHDDWEGIILKAATKITGVTVVGFLNNWPGGFPDDVSFDMRYRLFGTSSATSDAYLAIRPVGSNQIPIDPNDPPNRIVLDVTSAEPMTRFFQTPLAAKGYPDVTLIFGFFIRDVTVLDPASA